MEDTAGKSGKASGRYGKIKRWREKMETNELTQDEVVIDVGELLNFFMKRAF